jgi:hypothetical protein
MTKTLRLLLLTAAVATVALGGAARAFACGNSGGYSYAGVGAPENAYGVSAVISALNPLDSFDVVNGHVAGWVGVGGPGEGPNGSDEWIQVGYAAYPSITGITGSDIYYEVARPGHYPRYTPVARSVGFGTEAKMTVLEIHCRANWWRVWVNHKPVSPAIYLPGSHDRWMPIATAESWDGGTGGACNTFLYRFRRVSIAHAPGGGWHQLTGGYPIQSAVSRIRRARGSARFFAAEGRAAFAALSATS